MRNTKFWQTIYASMCGAYAAKRFVERESDVYGTIDPYVDVDDQDFLALAKAADYAYEVANAK